MWHDLITAVALLLVLEGILPFLNPASVRKAMEVIAKMDDKQLRFGGLTSMVAGVVILYLVNG
jgi:uncharacterized protein YjeT (DUF2065 family)